MPLRHRSVRQRIARIRRRLFHRARRPKISSSRPILRSISALLLLAVVLGADALQNSYKYYSQIIDARLATGYLTSRPGLYAAPRTLRAGQGFSQAALVNVLQRAGYIETKASEVWSGGFKQGFGMIEIRPQRFEQKSEPRVIRISFEEDRIAGLTGDDLTVDSFTLAHEVLTNDLSAKTGNHKTLAYRDIPPVLVQAIMAIEDRRFFQHSGIDVFAVARALFRNAGDERIGQGGSTLSQQLVKNTYLSPERTLRRKYAEAMLAFALERRLSKEDIFALYCNEVYLGQRGAVVARGVAQAAEIYFGKNLKDLSLSEAATIAGMIQGPARYSPERNKEATKARRDTVLAAMVRDGWISPELSATTSAQPVTVVPLPNSARSVAPHFIDYVNRVTPEADTHAGTQRVYTTIDLDLQQLAEAALQEQLKYLDKLNQRGTARPEVALVALDPHTGNVLAMVGGRDYGQSQLNRATDANRQPGSTFKPFVYAAAVEDGFSPMQLYEDAPREFTYDRNKTYRPANFGGTYSQREVTMRTGLVKSLNVVTVDVALRTGLARVANLASQFGLPRPERYPALALGTTEATPMQLAAAYATFVNGGRRVEPKVITSVGEPPNESLTSTADGAQVIKPTTAYMITNMLAAIVDHGTGRAARDALKGTAVAGKTGTSRDGWFIGYTPNLVCAVWIGFDDNSQLGLTGATAALPVWSEFMKGAVALRPELGGRVFECPEGIKFVETDVESGLISTLSCPHRELVAITDRLAPNFECYNHGNLPELMFDSGDASSVASETTTFAQHAKPRALNPRNETYLSPHATRVETDSAGKRTLINAMR